MQTFPITLEEYHRLKTVDSITERYSTNSRGDIYTYLDKVKDFYIPSKDRRLLSFHKSIKHHTAYDEFGEARDLDLFHPLDLYITYAPSRLVVPYASLKFWGRHPDNAEYFQFILINFLIDESKAEDLLRCAEAIFWDRSYGARA